MEAIVLAGGLGTRLRDVIVDLPKPMAPINGRPFLEFLLRSLARKGFRRVILSLGYLAETVSSYFGSNFAGLEIVYIVEDVPLGTGGAVRLALTACKQDHVFIFNGDTYTDLEVDQIERRWQSNRNPIIVGKRVLDTSRYGRMMVEGNLITGFTEKGQHGNGLINAGCYVLPVGEFDQFALNHHFSIETDYFVPAAMKMRLEVFVTDSIFIDIGIPEDYLLAQTILATNGALDFCVGWGEQMGDP
jgi:D-glycero-alpha-D-manno-heptose 1-phosphate guanylyltransferase